MLSVFDPFKGQTTYDWSKILVLNITGLKWMHEGLRRGRKEEWKKGITIVDFRIQLGIISLIILFSV